MEHMAILVLGLLIVGLGVVNLLGNISTVHRYNCRRVREEDVPRYGRAIGIGTIVIGVAMVADFALICAGLTAAVPFVLLPALAVGLGFILYAQFKYNGGLF